MTTNWIPANKVEDWIPMTECVHGTLYRVAARNFTIGVYTVEQQGFVGVREKFSKRFPFVEYHWDTGEPHGTAKPIEIIDICPHDIAAGRWIEGSWVENTEIMRWLERRLK